MRKILFTFLLCTLFASTYAQQSIMLAEKIIYKVIIRDPENPENSNVYANIDESQRLFYMKTLMEAVEAGKLQVFSDEDFLYPLSLKDIDNILTVRDTAYVPNPDNPSEEMMVAVEEEIALEEITAINFMEQWTFDKNSSQIMKRIIAVAPLLEVMVDSYEGNEVIGHKLLFWIKF